MSTALANINTADTDPRRNGAKIRAIFEAGHGFADLYRTAVAGPSGQRTRIHVGRVRLMDFGPDDFRIIDPRTGDLVGYARTDPRNGWTITAHNGNGGLKWIGYAETLSLGCDVLINGVHAATGRHDTHRVSRAWWISAESVHAERARDHATRCPSCIAAGETRGWVFCTA